MAAPDPPNNGRPIAIAPAPALAFPANPTSKSDSHQITMLYACLSCATRKIRCDKIAPICSSCRKNKTECVYQAPAPRKRRRRLSGDGDEKLARYERILRKHDLLPPEDDSPNTLEGTPQDPVTLRFQDSHTGRSGRLVARHGKSIFVNSNLWRNIGDEEMQQMSDEDEDEPSAWSDPLTGAFMSQYCNLLDFHPSHWEAMKLWEIHIDSVEPLCKILHIPTISKMVERVSQEPSTASKNDECLLFAIYHFAIFTTTEEECEQSFGQSRTSLLQKYQFAARQALVNASFLRTMELSILQAYILYLAPCRFVYEAHTNWILTGVAVRIAQRMGIHRDGEKLGLPPFDVEMRRRLFIQLIQLDGMASQTSGTGIAIDTWDTEWPLNVNDDQLWPGMTEKPKELKQATEMVFCLSRASVGKYFAKSAQPSLSGSSGAFKDYIGADATIDEAENEVENKYIRYLDIVNPLHFLTMCQARSAITAMRLRVRLPKARNDTATPAERKEIFQLAEKIMDTDATACANAGLKKYLWIIRSFFAFGSWDSLLFVLKSLRSADLLTRAETDAAWSKVEQVYNNRAELTESKRALHIAVGRLALKAWDANPSSNAHVEPGFITKLRSRHQKGGKFRAEPQANRQSSLDASTDTLLSVDPSPSSDDGALFAGLSSGMGFEMGHDFSIDTADWMFWDQLIRDNQSQGIQPQILFSHQASAL